VKMDRKFWFSLVPPLAFAVVITFGVIMPSSSVGISVRRQTVGAAFALWGLTFWIVSSFTKASDRIVTAVGCTPTRNERDDDVVVRLANHR